MVKFAKGASQTRVCRVAENAIFRAAFPGPASVQRTLLQDDSQTPPLRHRENSLARAPNAVSQGSFNYVAASRFAKQPLAQEDKRTTGTDMECPALAACRG